MQLFGIASAQLTNQSKDVDNIRYIDDAPDDDDHREMIFVSNDCQEISEIFLNTSTSARKFVDVYRRDFIAQMRIAFYKFIGSWNGPTEQETNDWPPRSYEISIFLWKADSHLPVPLRMRRVSSAVKPRIGVQERRFAVVLIGGIGFFPVTFPQPLLRKADKLLILTNKCCAHIFL